MKTDIHPQYYQDAKVTCACGNAFTVGSTVEKMEVEVCSNCHPFYTGDTSTKKAAGRVEKFKARQEAAKGTVKSKHEKKAEKREKRAVSKGDAAESKPSKKPEPRSDMSEWEANKG